MTDLETGIPADIFPENVEVWRKDRYRGGGFELPPEQFESGEREVLRGLYDGLESLYRDWLAQRDAPDWDALARRVEALARGRVVLGLRELEATGRTNGSGEVRHRAKVVHDIRGGGLTSLVVQGELLEEDPGDRELIRSAVLLARDHAKMMRNALAWLDPSGRARDEDEHPHHMDDVVRKWTDFRYLRPDDGEELRVEVGCRYDGLLATCCLEVSALDRVIFNLANNALRASAAPRVRLEIDPVEPDAVRWLVVNAIDDENQAWLSDKLGDEPQGLFEEGLSRGSHGLGLANCADFVAAAFGLNDPGLAVEEGYVGVWFGNGLFAAWAHWPALERLGEEP